MGNPLGNWWRSSRFQTALKKGNLQRAQEIFAKITKSGAKLSNLEKLFQQKLALEESASFYKRELANATNGNVISIHHEIECLTIEPKLVEYIRQSCRLKDHDIAKIQCTGIEPEVFNKLEASLATFLEQELKKIPANILNSALVAAIQDLDELEQGRNPRYNSKLSPYVYFLKYFPQSFYSNYLAWFLIYQNGLLAHELKVLDLGAGLGTVAYSLAAFLQTSSKFLSLPNLHISYYSLEKHALLQFRGLQFWQKSLESQQVGTNIYFRFDTADILEHRSRTQKLPEDFFNFIVISHCFFTEEEQRITTYQIYKEIFQTNLAEDGYVLLVVPSKILWQSYQLEPQEDIYQEENLIGIFLEELGLELEWYKYLTSTDTRIPLNLVELRQFSQEKLPKMNSLNQLKSKYLNQTFESTYMIDNYIILAKPSKG